MRKFAGDIIILHKCTNNHNDVQLLRYGLRQTEFVVILCFFGPFTPLPNDSENQNFEKMKKNLKIFSFYKCIP